MKKYQGKVVVFCLPGRSFTNNFLTSWSELLLWCINNGITPLMVNRYSPNLYYVRNMCLGGNTVAGIHQKPFSGQVKYDYLMWIDSDVVFTPKQFVDLLEMNKPIASGLYMMHDNVHYATVEEMNDDIYRKNGHYKFLTREDLKNKVGPFPVDYTGFGWMLIKQGVFEELEYPWFRPLWSDFSTETTTIQEFCMEDVAFCKLVKEKGYPVWIHPNVIVGHEKMMIL